jgi:hypothetical protein
VTYRDLDASYDAFLSSLTPGLQSDYWYKKWYEEFVERVAVLDQSQKHVVRQFLDLYKKWHGDDFDHYLDPAIRYWQQY